jgi:hypothetical protein
MANGGSAQAQAAGCLTGVTRICRNAVAVVSAGLNEVNPPESRPGCRTPRAA